MIKTRQDNDMTNQIGLVDVKTEIELSGPIELGVVFYENQTIVQVRCMPIMKLGCHDR